VLDCVLSESMDCTKCTSRCVSKPKGQKGGRLSPFELLACELPAMLRSISNDSKFADMLERLVGKAQKAASASGTKLEQGSINNNRGELNEVLVYLFGLAHINEVNHGKKTTFVPIKMPSSTEGRRFGSIFQKPSQKALEGVPIRFPNPDLLVVSSPAITSSRPSQLLFQNVTGLKKRNLQVIIGDFREGYMAIMGKIRPSDVAAVISMKTTTRPDRRYICLYESESIKSVFSRLGKKVRYFVFGLKLTKQDKKVLEAPPVACIADPGCTSFVPRIDGVFDIRTVGDLHTSLDEILNNWP